MIYSALNKFLRESIGLLYPEREIDSIGRLVLEHLTGMNWVQIRLNFEQEFSPGQENRIGDIIARLKKNEPIQYILGETEFYGLKFRIRPGVLIPRGETEELVEWIISIHGKGRGPAGACPRESGGGDDNKTSEEVGRVKIRVLDIGCGSGVIAISLAKYLPDAEVFAVDISDPALELTRENAALNGLNAGSGDQAPFRVGHFDIFSPGSDSGRFDVIVSNPPYVPLGEMTAMDRHVVEYEPGKALFVPDEDPLVFYRAISEYAHSNLSENGEVYVEIHDRLGQETAGVFRKWFTAVELRRDIHGKERMIRAHHG